jgi:hypothetical protein
MLCAWYKLAWFEQEWTDNTQVGWVSNVRGYVEKLWQSEYKPSNVRPKPWVAAGLPSTFRDSPFARQAEAKRLKLTHSPASVDELTAYLALNPIEEGAADPIQYWLERRFQFPNMSKLAFDTLAIPPMADDNERSISSAQDLISYHRSRLKEDIVEASECLYNWCGRPEANASNRLSDVCKGEARKELLRKAPARQGFVSRREAHGHPVSANGKKHNDCQLRPLAGIVCIQICAPPTPSHCSTRLQAWTQLPC